MRFLIFTVFIVFSLAVHSQEYIMFWNEKSQFNPAASGVDYKYYGTLTGKEQWVGMKDAPEGGLAFLDMKLEPLHGGGGVSYKYTHAGPFRLHNLNLNYSYHFELNKDRILSLGASGGLSFESVDWSSIDIYGTDGMIISTYDKYTFYNLGFGVFYATKHLEIGLSSVNLVVPDKYGLESNIIDNYYLFGLYRIQLNEKIEILPCMLIATPYNNNNNVSFSSGLTMMYRKRFWTGITWSDHQNGTLGFMAGYDIMGMIRLGYAFGINTNTRNKYGNHEILVSFMMK